jgi:hypothetical protein
MASTSKPASSTLAHHATSRRALGFHRGSIGSSHSRRSGVFAITYIIGKLVMPRSAILDAIFASAVVALVRSLYVPFPACSEPKAISGEPKRELAIIRTRPVLETTVKRITKAGAGARYALRNASNEKPRPSKPKKNSARSSLSHR